MHISLQEVLQDRPIWCQEGPLDKLSCEIPIALPTGHMRRGNTVMGPVVDSGRVAMVVTMTSLSFEMGHAPGKLAPDCPVRADPTVCPCATATRTAAAAKQRSIATPTMGADEAASLQGKQTIGDNTT